jgi:acyl-coenzyme A synthetase/AMP-(fatty) acid ligase
VEHYLPSGPLLGAGYFACQKISAIAAPIRGMNRAHEVRPIPKRTQTPVMVADTHALAVAGRAQRGEAQGDNPRHPDATALIAFCRENLAAYKVPRRLFTVREMPHGPTGKILKRTLRDWLAEGRLTEVTP